MLTEVRSQRKGNASLLIGYLAFGNKRSLDEGSGLAALRYQGALARAHELNFKLEVFEISPQMPGKRLTEIMLYRQVCGLICSVMPTTGRPLDVDFGLFPAVAYGYAPGNPPIHRVTLSHFHSVLLSMKRLRELGYRRIGFTTSIITHERLDGLQVAGCDAFHRQVRPKERVPLLMVDDDSDGQPFKRWYEKYRPDAVFLGPRKMDQWPKQAGLRVPDDLAVATLDRPVTETWFAGLDANSYQVGVTAVDVLAQQIYTNQRGAPAHQTVVLLNGAWVDGPSAPLKN